jgi:hypothetical protein
MLNPVRSHNEPARKEIVENLNKIIKKRMFEYSMSIVQKVINNKKFLDLKKDLYPELYQEIQEVKPRK